MDVNSSSLQSPEAAQQALNALRPVQLLFGFVGIIAVFLFLYAFIRFQKAQAKLAKASNPGEHKPVKAGMGPAIAKQAEKKGTVAASDYVGLTKEEMKMVFEAEMKRRREAGEEIVVKNVFEGPLDWDDIDEEGKPRVRAEKPPDFDAWRREQQAPRAPESDDKPKQ